MRKSPSFIFILSTLLAGCAEFWVAPDGEYDDDYAARAESPRRRGPAGERFRGEAARFVPSNDITLGMDMGEVRSIWGEPTEIQMAGTPSAGNQRWMYPDSVLSHLGVGGKRIVYFENGRVAGWESPQTGY